jgi:predicted MFS family arabinose efflux permease
MKLTMIECSTVTTAMLAAMTISFAALFWALREHSLALICFFVWGVAVWGSQAPQQHRLLSMRPRHASTAVALRSSSHYLGSAAGAALGGFALAAGIAVLNLPFFAVATASVTLAGQLF